jgi:hypothetical protein
MTLLSELVEKHARDLYESTAAPDAHYEEYSAALLAFGRELLEGAAKELDALAAEMSENVKEFRKLGLILPTIEAEDSAKNYRQAARRLRELASAGEGKNG